MISVSGMHHQTLATAHCCADQEIDIDWINLWIGLGWVGLDRVVLISLGLGWFERKINTRKEESKSVIDS